MKHMLDGIAIANPPEAAIQRESFAGRVWLLLPASARNDVFFKLFLYIACFGLIMAVSLLNPQSFLLVLEVFTSSALNVEAGSGIAVIYFLSRYRSHSVRGALSST